MLDVSSCVLNCVVRAWVEHPFLVSIGLLAGGWSHLRREIVHRRMPWFFRRSCWVMWSMSLTNLNVLFYTLGHYVLLDPQSRHKVSIVPYFEVVLARRQGADLASSNSWLLRDHWVLWERILSVRVTMWWSDDVEDGLHGMCWHYSLWMSDKSLWVFIVLFGIARRSCVWLLCYFVEVIHAVINQLVPCWQLL